MTQKTPKRIKQLRTHRGRGARQTFAHAPSPTVALSNKSLGKGLAIFIVTTLLVLAVTLPVFLWSHDLGEAIAHAVSDALKVAGGVSVIYYVFPLIAVVAYALFHQQRLPRQQWQRYSLAQKGVSMALVAIGGFYLFNHLFVTAQWAWLHHYWPAHAWHDRGYVTNRWHEGILLLGATGLLMCLAPFLLTKTAKRPSPTKWRLTFRQPRPADNGPISFYLGQSTGTLANRWHPTGLTADLSIVLSAEDAAQNILVLGGSGSGKTTRIMQPMLAQLLDQHCGALIFDVKGDVIHAARL